MGLLLQWWYGFFLSFFDHTYNQALTVNQTHQWFSHVWRGQMSGDSKVGCGSYKKGLCSTD